MPKSMPDSHRRFLTSLLDVLQRDQRIVGIAAGGSYLTDSMDEFSDIDLIIAVEAACFDTVMNDRHHIAASLGPLAGAFTGEHVGEPRLLVCLYDTAPPIHVDLKFVSLPDIALRVEDPVVLWEREKGLTYALEKGHAVYPTPDPQWIEDRFWIWVHYAATKIGRGELFEALECLSFFRVHVLGPLILLRSGHQPAGVRRLEKLAPGYTAELRRTTAGYDRAECLHALQACIELYQSLRGDAVEYQQKAERAAMQYVSEIDQRARRPKHHAGRN